MYRIRNFIFRLRRGLSWFIFSFKQNPWQERGELYQTIEKVLLDTANHFEQQEQKGYPVGWDNKENVADMRLAAKLIRMKIDEHYWNLYTEEQRNPDYVLSDRIENLFGEGENAFYKPSYKYEDALLAEKRDDRALRIAMNIIVEKGPRWWI